MINLSTGSLADFQLKMRFFRCPSRTTLDIAFPPVECELAVQPRLKKVLTTTQPQKSRATLRLEWDSPLVPNPNSIE